jgi:hypothetical protein
VISKTIVRWFLASRRSRAVGYQKVYPPDPRDLQRLLAIARLDNLLELHTMRLDTTADIAAHVPIVLRDEHH